MLPRAGLGWPGIAAEVETSLWSRKIKHKRKRLPEVGQRSTAAAVWTGEYTGLNGTEAKGKSSRHEGIDMRSGECGVEAWWFEKA